MKHLILPLSLIISIFSATAFGQCIKGDCDNGHGTYTYSNGTQYDGQWKNGRLNGQGILTYPDGSQYAGQWKDNQRHGKGTYIYSDGSQYAGQFKENRRNGKGTYIHSDSSKYVGLFKDGKRNGKGTYTFSDGSQYEGQWKNNQRHGNGTYTFPDGRTYMGQWQNNTYFGVPESAETRIPDSKKIAEKKSRKAQSYISYKVPKKLAKKQYHTVHSGETLWGISRHYGQTLENIRTLNKLNEKSVIYPGQKLLVAL